MSDGYDRIIVSVDLLDIVQKAGAEMHRTGAEYRGFCPLHKGSNRTAFSVYHSGDRWRWKCYSKDCGGGDVIDFVAAWQHTDPKGAYEWLGGSQKVTPEQARIMAEERSARAAAFASQKKLEYEQALDKLHKARAWERYCTYREGSEPARGLWRARGIPDDWQNYWSLGYNPDFIFKHDDVLYHSPTLTIPIFNGGDEPANIRHRILKPADPGDKYRPEFGGLKSLPFIADPVQVDALGKCLVVEGEIKAAVTYIWLDNPEFQVYGIPGKQAFGDDLADRLKDKEVWVLFDPDATQEAIDAARQVDGRVIQLPTKIDDALNNGTLTKAGLKRLMSMGRKS